MIRATIQLHATCKFIEYAWFREAPHVGTCLYMKGKNAAFYRENFGTLTFRVKEVGHNIATAWSPEDREGEDPRHSLVVFIEPEYPAQRAGAS